MIGCMLRLDDAPRVSANAVSLACHQHGSGAPLVLVHGGVSDLRTWSGQIAAFGDLYRTIAYSRRYALPNEPIAEGSDDQMQPHVDDLLALLEGLEAAPAHVVGHSWGGFIALLLAMQHQQAVRSLTLIEPPVLTLFVDMPPGPGPLLRLLLRRPRLAAAIVKLGAGAMMPAQKAFGRGDDAAAIAAFGKGVLGPAAFGRLSAARKEQVWQNRAPERAQMLGAGYPPLLADEVRRVTVPALLLGGAQSPPVFRHLSAALHELLPNSEVETIPGASHLVHEDAPEAFNRAVLAFLARADHPPAPGAAGQAMPA